MCTPLMQRINITAASILYQKLKLHFMEELILSKCNLITIDLLFLHAGVPRARGWKRLHIQNYATL